MKFEKFLQTAQDQKFWEKSLIIFSSEDKFGSNQFGSNQSGSDRSGSGYPSSFFYTLFKTVNKSVTRLTDMSASREIMLSLQQTFLGDKMTYFLGDISSIKDEKLLKYIKSYSGPHKIIFFSKNIKSDAISIEESLNRELFIKLAIFFNKREILLKKELLNKIFKQNPVLSLNHAIMIINFLELVSLKSSDDIDLYLSLLIESSQSFFTMNNYFFAGNKVKFFEIWSKVSKSYPEVFWTRYWSNLTWKAYNVCRFMSEGKEHEAGQITGLPFAFIKSYYKNYNLKSLAAEHDFIYKSDCYLKSGSTFPLIDLFYLKHFSQGSRPQKF